MKDEKRRSNGGVRDTAKSSRSQVKEKIHGFRLENIYSKISRSTLVFMISFVLVVVFFFGVWKFIDLKFIAPVDRSDTTTRSFVVESGSGSSTIAKNLEEEGFIRSSTAYQIYLDLNNKSNKLKAGTFELSPSMTMAEITDKLMVGGNSGEVIDFMFTEGKTVENLAQQLLDLGVIDSKETFLEHMKTGESYIGSHGFMEEAADKDGVRYVMEGFLFPDTYEIYANSTEEMVIEKLLTRFDEIFSDEYRARAEELGMTPYEVLTLASIIEKEGRTEDFKKVSAVFHNRLEKGYALESCATVQYALGIQRLHLTNEDISADSPYNTYKYTGLPAGPICNPGKAAIEAALYPDEDFMKDGYLFFCSKDPTSGELAFAKTAEEHAANQAKYAPAWDAWDEQNGY